eukprot:6928-Pelagococcus_subviridis.AAC.4
MFLCRLRPRLGSSNPPPGPLIPPPFIPPTPDPIPVPPVAFKIPLPPLPASPPLGKTLSFAAREMKNPNGTIHTIIRKNPR